MLGPRYDWGRWSAIKIATPGPLASMAAGRAPFVRTSGLLCIVTEQAAPAVLQCFPLDGSMPRQLHGAEGSQDSELWTTVRFSVRETDQELLADELGALRAPGGAP